MASKKGAFMLLGASAAGGVGFIWVKCLLNYGFSPLQVIAGRYLASCVFMFLLCRFKKCHIDKSTVKKGIVLGIVLFISFVLMTEGSKRTTPSVNAFLTNTQAVMIPLIMLVLYGKKPDIYVTVGSALTFLGVGLISFSGTAEFTAGAFLSLGAAVMFSLMMVLLGSFVEKCEPVALTSVENYTVFALALLISLIKGETLVEITLVSVSAFAALGFLCTFIYFVLLSAGQKYTPASTAGIIITTESVFALIASVFIYGEKPALTAVCGCFVIFAAVIIAEIKPSLRNKLTTMDK